MFCCTALLIKASAVKHRSAKPLAGVQELIEISSFSTCCDVVPSVAPHARVPARTHTHSHTYTHTHVYTPRACEETNMHAHAHKNTHTQTHQTICLVCLPKMLTGRERLKCRGLETAGVRRLVENRWGKEVGWKQAVGAGRLHTGGDRT